MEDTAGGGDGGRLRARWVCPAALWGAGALAGLWIRVSRVGEGVVALSLQLSQRGAVGDAGPCGAAAGLREDPATLPCGYFALCLYPKIANIEISCCQALDALTC